MLTQTSNACRRPIGRTIVNLIRLARLAALGLVGAVVLASAPRAAADEPWVPLAGSPKGLQNPTAVYDPVGQRLIQFGGFYVQDATNETWVLSLTGTPHWTPLATAGTPPSARSAHSAIYDPNGPRMIVFGGNSGGTALNDAWELRLSGTPTWAVLSPGGTPPTPRYYAGAVYDPAGTRMIVFGGTTTGGGATNVYALSLGGAPAWSNITPALPGPAARDGHGVAMDPAGARMLVFGGRVGATFANDVWQLSLGGTPGWSTLSPAGTPPSGRSNGGVVWDAVAQRLLVFGGRNNSGYLNDVAALNLSGAPAWLPLAPTGAAPTTRAWFATLVDPVGNRMIAVGGYRGEGEYLDQAWALSLGGAPAWSSLGGDPDPGPKRRHAAAYDAVGQRMILYQSPGEVWALPLTGPAVWSPLIHTSQTTVGSDAAAACDPAGDRLIVYDGATGQLRALSLGATPTWTVLSPTGAPPTPARLDATLVYDPYGARLLLFGGHSVSDTAKFNEVWALTLGATPAWSLLSPAGGPPAVRWGHTAVVDLADGRMVICGGAGPGGHTLGDVWGLALTGPLAWTQIPATGAPLASFMDAAAVYDPTVSRMVLTFGDATYALPLTGPPAWQMLAPPGVRPRTRSLHVAIHDPVGQRMIVQGGVTWEAATTEGDLDDTWALPLTPATAGVAVASSEGGRLALRVTPNPTRGAAVGQFTLAAPRRVAGTIYDALGRVVRRIPLTFRTAGAQEIAWDGRDTAGHRVAAGAYFLRVDSTDLHGTARILVVR